jgi:hypothetical protein
MAATLTGTPTAINWGGLASPAPQNVTIPSDATAVYAFAGGYSDGNENTLPTFTLAGAAPNQTVNKSGLGATLTSGGGAVWYNPPTGTQSLTISWSDGAIGNGPNCIVAYVKGGDTTSWRDADATNAPAADAVSVTLTTASGDLVLKFDQRVGSAAPALSAGWTNAQTQVNVGGDSARLSTISASGATQVCNAEDESYSLVVAVSIPAAPVAASLPFGSGSRNLLTGRLPHLRMSEAVASERRIREGRDAADVVRASKRGEPRAFSFLSAP